ncbi:hypothetical protein JCM3770_007467, partial [Rhodotorula araucariae]
MRSALSLSLASAILVAAPLSSAVPTRIPRDVPPSPSSDASGATKIRLHRRGSAELMQEDGSIDFAKSH